MDERDWRRHSSKRLRDAAGSERIPAEDFTALVGDTFRHAGLSPADADIAAEVAAYGTLHGSDAHGAVQMPLYVTGLLDGTIKSAPNVKTTNNLPCCMVMDADNALGLVVGQQAIDAAIDLAKKYGLGAVAVRNSSHFGGAGYLFRARGEAGPDRLRLHQCVARDRADRLEGGAARHQSDRRRVPAARRRSDRRRHGDQRGRALAHPRHAGARPEDACPTAGRSIPTASRPSIPAVAVKGSVLPIGGPKGYALSLMVELLCSALSDGEPGFQVTYENVVKRPSTISQFFFAMNPEGFVGLDRYGKRAAHIADKVKKRQADRGRAAAAAARRARRRRSTARAGPRGSPCSTICGTR